MEQVTDGVVAGSYSKTNKMAVERKFWGRHYVTEIEYNCILNFEIRNITEGWYDLLNFESTYTLPHSYIYRVIDLTILWTRT